jgi:ATP-binding cassette, subfamily C (CFTR/MRP), member 4
MENRRRDDDHDDNVDHMDGSMAQASIWSRFWFDWNKPLLRLGQTRPLEKNDLEYWAAHVDRSHYNRNYIESLYQAEKERVVAATTIILRRGESCSTPRRSPSLAQAIARDFFRTTWLSRLLIMVNSLAKIGQAIALGLLLDTFEIEETDDPESSVSSLMSSGYFWAVVIICCGLITFPSKQHSFFLLYRKGAQYRTGLTAAIYAKTLRLPSIRQAHTAAATTTTAANEGTNNNGTSGGQKNTAAAKTGSGGGGGGHVTNLASNDVERFVLTSIYANILLASPIEIIAILLVGIYTIGPVFACGYLLLLIMVPMQYILSRRFVLLRSKIAAYTDARVHLVAQAVSGARVLKLQGWEKELEHKIAILRDREIYQLARANGLKAWNDTIYYTSSLVVATTVLGLHVGVFHGTLTPRIVFTTFTLWNLLQYSVTKHIPHAIMGLSECYVACQRIQTFLDLPEASSEERGQQHQEPTSGKDSHANGATTNNAISSSVAMKIRGAETETSTAVPRDDDESPLLSLENVTCYWDPSVTTTMGLKASQYVRNVALQDISLQFRSGTLYCVIGKVGSGKTALLQALIGELPIAKGRVTRSSRRSTDPHTLTMSYAAQDPWIMDGTARENITMGLDFDAEWYGQIVRSCCLEADFAQFRQGDQTIVGDRGVQCSGGQKARLSLARAIYCNAQILILDDPLSAVDAKVARTIYYDAIQDLCVRRGKCVVLVTHQHQFVGAPGNICILLKQGKLVCCGSFAECAAQSGGTIDEALQTESNDEKESNNNDSANPVNDPDPNIQETTVANTETDAAFVEKRETGSIKRSTWGSYGEALGGPLVCGLFLFLFAATQGAFLITVLNVAKWGEARATDQNSSAWFGLVYGLTAGTVCLALIRSQLSFRLFLQASKRLHNKMLRSVLRATIEFYDTNPLGRILNRFAADVGISDELLPFTIYEFGVGFVMFVGSIITAIAILPLTLLVFPFLLWSFVRLKHVFVQTTRELKRLEGLGRSPIYAMLSESLTGVATIRTNNKTEYFRNKFEALHDGLISAQFGFIGVSRWFATQMDFLSFMFLATSTVCAVLVQDQVG